MTTYNDILEIEEYLYDLGLFVSMFDDNRKADPDAYGTILAYDKVDQIDLSEFPLDAWPEAVEYWKTNSNCGPALILVAGCIERML